MPRMPVESSSCGAMAWALLFALAWAAPAEALVTPTVTAAPACASAEAAPEPAPEPDDDEEAPVVVSGQILYDARRGKDPVPAVVDIVTVYGSHPAYMHMKARGHRETDPKGRPLFATAQSDVNRSLVEAARRAGVNVVTVPGGVTGATEPVPDLTRDVTDRLPLYHVHGEVHYGRAKGALRIAELDSRAVLAAIPAWQEAQSLSEDDARFHLLRHRYMTELNRVVRAAARAGNHDAVVETGGVTSRLGAVPDITASAVGTVGR